ncbi:HTH domain-containing protein [Halomarina litorea]|uniref:HTH domain-containing protein n=1 Tax=Halomarina litorea TaxID=2961595 RepID=UPI0020C48102|nr:HTH domain-containing protein [Halomarina sp. BCD28]
MSTLRADGEAVHAELFVRSLTGGSAHGIQQEVVERLSALAASGRLDGFDLHVWGRELPHDSAAARSETGRFVADRLAAFRQWARDNDLSLPAVTTTDRASAITEEAYTATTLPRIALAEYVDGELRHVAPCEGPECHTAVADRVAALEAGRDEPDDITRVPVAPGVAAGDGPAAD